MEGDQDKYLVSSASYPIGSYSTRSPGATRRSLEDSYEFLIQARVGGLTLQDDVDRTTWVRDVVHSNPQIKELKERIKPLNRAVSFCKMYNPGKPQVREKLDKEVMIQLVLQHLRAKGLHRTHKMLQQESGIKCKSLLLVFLPESFLTQNYL